MSADDLKRDTGPLLRLATLKELLEEVFARGQGMPVPDQGTGMSEGQHLMEDAAHLLHCLSPDTLGTKREEGS